MSVSATFGSGGKPNGVGGIFLSVGTNQVEDELLAADFQRLAVAQGLLGDDFAIDNDAVG